MAFASGAVTLPDFPWDALIPHAAVARSHPDGIVDLSVGTPTDSTPDVVQHALSAAADAPGYPSALGSDALRTAASAWMHRRLGVDCPGEQVLPTIGSKETVALLPSLLGRRGRVLIPELAYPTYDVGARLAGCEPDRVAIRDGLIDVDALDPVDAVLLWVNYPANPHGAVAPAEHMRAVIEWGRGHGVLIASDECYIELGWTVSPTSALAFGTEGVLALHSLSKRSSAAGYRAALISGDAAAIAAIHELRRHIGLLVPAPVQAAMTAALGDDEHVVVQRARYAERRDLLLGALGETDWQVDHSDGGLYLWACHPGYADCWDAVGALAKIGVLVAPGAFYGASGERHVRFALTAPTDRVAAAASRLREASR